ncbi:predicted protein [Sclerotinia sclerotiorum 1980 UF-70]|uniref:Uncharacterized protein n=1 Tax=Sclerotinia sclerotiorum (strain ATCC 18683 / 1980 / Ss-1) TaxID=665079 RepID=A7ER66_SCLS1|nr:predicted protein [Sclerotinia sclerotiorum 1980 UF-70]EDN91958.1 predicted protein [Sclerotinia sclerotiorum 1980 UF-70]
MIGKHSVLYCLLGNSNTSKTMVDDGKREQLNSSQGKATLYSPIMSSYPNETNEDCY